MPCCKEKMSWKRLCIFNKNFTSEKEWIALRPIVERQAVKIISFGALILVCRNKIKRDIEFWLEGFEFCDT